MPASELNLLPHAMTSVLRRCNVATLVACSGLGLLYVVTQTIANRRDGLSLDREVDWSVQALHGIHASPGRLGLSPKQAEELFL
jgi:hypothetical protein